VEIRAPSPKGPIVTQEDLDRWNEASEMAKSTKEEVRNNFK